MTDRGPCLHDPASTQGILGSFAHDSTHMPGEALFISYSGRRRRACQASPFMTRRIDMSAFVRPTAVGPRKVSSVPLQLRRPPAALHSPSMGPAGCFPPRASSRAWSLEHASLAGTRQTPTSAMSPGLSLAGSARVGRGCQVSSPGTASSPSESLLWRGLLPAPCSRQPDV
jgi:hypothetical protein